MTTDTLTSVTSSDGTAIGYRRLGDGPGVVLVHGAMSSSYNHIELAGALADSFTVYVPDRRGRGLSGPYRHDHGLRSEVDDLAAVLKATGARSVFGCSSGAIVALEAALTVPTIRRVAIFEPPLYPDRR
ncbi:MAG TPA: alpha/beta hydrolase, partial [Acidothermales bacterium]